MGEVEERGAFVSALTPRWRMSRYAPWLTRIAVPAKSKRK
jgi:hypothetical protein